VLPQINTSRLPPTRHQGTLGVTGTLRDGGTVRAAGLSWRPGALPPGDRLLSFEVGYYWSACTAAGQCHPAADTTATPFAARRYVAGHADTGRFLKITETATEVVETSPATFSFSLKSTSVSRMTSGKVRAYQAGRPPSSEFVNGTPEPHRVGGGVFQRGRAALQRGRRAGHPAVPGGPAALAAAARQPGALHRRAAHRPAPGGGAHGGLGRRDDRAVHLAGGAPARAAALPGDGAPALLVPAAPRFCARAPGALGLADRPLTPLQRTGKSAVDI
jgi:hypothetical protein